MKCEILVYRVVYCLKRQSQTVIYGLLCEYRWISFVIFIDTIFYADATVAVAIVAGADVVADAGPLSSNGINLQTFSFLPYFFRIDYTLKTKGIEI